MQAQGFDLKKNFYNNRFQPYLAYWGIVWTLFFILVNGFAVFWNFTASAFITACMYIYVSSLSPWLTVIPVRHQYPDICGLILWLQNYHAHQNLETRRNGLCHCQSELMAISRAHG